MANPFPGIPTEQIDADLSQAVDRIKRQYENYEAAFQKEAIQNSWDERIDKKEALSWKFKIYEVKESNLAHIVLEDFGTGGMNEKKWKAFVSLWKPEKDLEDAGGQGQGKFVLMDASNNYILIVESVSDEIPYQCKLLIKGRKSRDGKRYIIKDFIPNTTLLSHKGTRIWVYNTRESFVDTIKETGYHEIIRESWWQILGDRFNADIEVFGKKVESPDLPKPVEEIILLENFKLNTFGRIKRLVLKYYEEFLPEAYQGVRVQRSNMMIIRLPFEVHDDKYKGRFSGYIEFDKDLEKRLKRIEKTDHCGFLYESPWKETRELIKEKSNEFVSKIIPSGEDKRKINIRNLSRAIQKANDIIREHCPEIEGKGKTEIDIKSKEKGPIQIKYLTINKREVKFGEEIKPVCSVTNRGEIEKIVWLKIYLKRRGVKISEEKYKLRMNSGVDKLIRLSVLKLDKDRYQKGKYTIRATIEEDSKSIDTKSTSFFLEEKREKIKRGFISKVDFSNRDEPWGYKSEKKGVIRINLGHKDFNNVYNSFKTRKRVQNQQALYYIIKCCLDEAVNELLRLKLGTGETINPEELLMVIHSLKDHMYYDVYS